MPIRSRYSRRFKTVCCSASLRRSLHRRPILFSGWRATGGGFMAGWVCMGWATVSNPIWNRWIVPVHFASTLDAGPGPAQGGAMALSSHLPR